MKPGYYCPIPRGQRRAAARRWLAMYGQPPAHLGRIRRHVMSSGIPVYLVYRGPVYIGPVPPEDVLAWPGSELFTPRDLLSIWERDNDGLGEWRPWLACDRWALETLEFDYGCEWERWPDVIELRG